MELERSSGILLHITSLPSKYGIGDFGPEAYKFIDFLVETKQKLWQILPITMTSSPAPYSCIIILNKLIFEKKNIYIYIFLNYRYISIWWSYMVNIN